MNFKLWLETQLSNDLYPDLLHVVSNLDTTNLLVFADRLEERGFSNLAAAVKTAADPRYLPSSAKALETIGKYPPNWIFSGGSLDNKVTFYKYLSLNERDFYRIDTKTGEWETVVVPVHATIGSNLQQIRSTAFSHQWPWEKIDIHEVPKDLVFEFFLRYLKSLITSKSFRSASGGM